jgi:signal transduction histidine kinase
MNKTTPEAKVGSAQPRAWKVLLIEDDPRWRTVVELHLQAEGHSVISAGDGLAGLELAAQKPDVILCDIEMPRLNGFGVLEALRQQPGLAEIPFIFLTARTARADQRKGMVLGADDYLTKPFERHELIESIAGALAKRESLAQRLQHYTDEYRREMTAPWAHEMLTPLNGILGIAAMIESEAATITHAELRELARAIRDSARRQQSLARKLMQHFQLVQFVESGWTDPGAAVEAGAGIEDEVLGVAEQAGRSADLRLRCMPAAVRISPQWLRAAVRELAENAMKFSPPDAPVTVSGRIVDGLYRIEVIDRGPGMTPAEQEAVAAFRQFGREKQEQQGLGLGLAVARNVARIYRGSLSLEPGPDGRGLCAILELPLAD